jgi:hypothetical protein
MSYINFLAGAATRVITPPLDRGPVYLAGFQPNRPATGVEQDLTVRALALRLDEQSAVLVACDLIGLSLPDIEDIRARVAAFGIAPKSLIVACTHTHSAPDTLGLWGPDPTTTGVNRVYLETVKQAVAECAIEALTFCCPVKLRHATATLADLIENYRTPGLVDDQLAALQFIKPDGEVVATLLNLACHPEVLDGASTLLSPDYPGVACAMVEAAVGGTALHVSGALGGMLSPSIADRSPAGVRQMGAAYAEVALKALSTAPTCSLTKLLVRRTSFDLPFENPLFQQAHKLGIIRPRSLQDGQMATECCYIDLGPAQILSIPGELLPQLGFVLQQAMPGPCRILAGIADDEIGYILPDEEYVAPADYRSPGSQYEESMSLGPTTGSRVIAAALSLIRDERLVIEDG